VRGQIISVLIAGTGVFATLLSNYTPTANFPTFMSFSNYVLLSLFMLARVFKVTDGGSVVVKPLDQIALSNSVCFYTFAAFLDVEANFLVLSAYNYTSITSIMLLDCFTIPCSMLLSVYFLKARYEPRHYAGIALCLLGLSCIIASDLKRETSSNALIGDALCLAGAFLYACSNVLQVLSYYSVYDS